jgi:hypothetical protein
MNRSFSAEQSTGQRLRHNNREPVFNRQNRAPLNPPAPAKNSTSDTRKSAG